MSLVRFFTENIWGIIILSCLGSVLGYLLSVLLSVVFKSFAKYFKKKKRVKYLIETGSAFGSGCKTTYAQKEGSFHQILLVGDYIKDIVLMVGRILFYAIISVGFLVIFRAYWYSFPIIITIASFFIGFEYRRLRICLRVFNTMFKYVYGEEYYKSELEGIKQYWDSITKKDIGKKQ